MTDAGLAEYRRWASTPFSGVPKYSVVVPTYNEEWRILPTIGAISSHMSLLTTDWELLIADDGSTDTTVELVRDLELANLRIIPAVANAGKGDAVRRGVLAARGDIILFADADQSTPIEQFEQLEAELNNGADVAVGSRAAAGAEVENKSFARKVFSWGLQVVVKGIFRIPVADTQCGFKMFQREAAHMLFSRQLINDFSFDLEILYLARKFDLQTVEVPVQWIDAPGSKVNPTKVAIEFLRDLVIIKRNDLAGKYNHANHDLPEPAADSPAGTDSPTGQISNDISSERAA